MKPSIFSENDFNKVIKLTASEIWDKDSKRMRIIENEGCKTLVIWEDDYFKNREIIVNKCIDFLVKEE
jgi:very-short-patch-repair endonuclease